MNIFKLIVLFLLSLPIFLYAQNREPRSQMVRITDENDCLNLFEKRTDEGYTNGAAADFFFVKDHKSTFFIDRWMPKAGNASVNTFGWSAMQMMTSPRTLSFSMPQVNDYSYSATLFVTHSLHSSNPLKKYNIQSEVAAGVIGKPALGEGSQKLFHKLWRCQTPNGWNYQTKTDWLLNINIGAEKSIIERDGFDIIAGAKLSAGTMMNKASIYSIIRLGQMNKYFEGLINQLSSAKNSSNKTQFYLIAKPALEYTAYDALYEGGLFAGMSDYYVTAKDGGNRTFEMPKTIAKIDLGFVLASGKFSVAYLQKQISPAYNGRRKHAVGNITLGFAW